MIQASGTSRPARFDGEEMVKLSISLPNNTQVTLESDDFDVISRVLGMLLQGLPSEAAQVSVPAANIANGHNGSVEKSTDAVAEQPSPPPQSNGASHFQPSSDAPIRSSPQPQMVAPVSHGAFNMPVPPVSDPDDDGLFLELQTPAAKEDFTSFCQAVNPMGDMRRVVVAAEGATRFFRADGVNAEELGELFDLAGWRRANSFTQTLRNAARSKFGWLERVPGRAGCYAPTDLGRSVTLGTLGA